MRRGAQLGTVARSLLASIAMLASGTAAAVACASGDSDDIPGSQGARSGSGGDAATDVGSGGAAGGGSGGTGNASGGGPADGGVTCGNGEIDAGEDCDDGNAVLGDGCEPGCFFTCANDAQCSDFRSCNGAEICTADHTCAAGTARPNGEICGETQSCRNGFCVDNSSFCGDGLLAADEECDDGGIVPGDGCEVDCRFTCVSTDAARDCQNPCSNGAACDDVTHTCSPGTPVTDGVACGENMLCRGGSCAASSCGDGQIGSGEECDDTNTANADGCDNTCRFSCLSTDSSRNCAQSDPCLGTSTCDDASHRCSTPSPLADGEPCGAAGRYCRAGVCVQTRCGDGVQDPNEQCDDGNATNTDGCREDCTFSCSAAADCSDNRTCTADMCAASTHTCSNPPDTTQNGATCTEGSVSGICQSGVCTPVACGNGVVEAGEQCDKGSQNGPLSGCTQQCQFECNTNAGCDDANPCNGTEACTDVSGGKRCEPGTPLGEGSNCGTDPRRVCTANQSCVASTCSDGIVDSGAGEQCDDANTDDLDGCRNDCTFTCTANDQCLDGSPCTSDICNTSAHTCSNPSDPAANGAACSVNTTPGTCDNGACIPAECGNGLVESTAGEECDKGAQNGQSGSGCTSSCRFECTSNANCSDGNPCNGSETCATVTGGRTCQPGAPLAQGDVCQTSPRRICDTTNSCVTSSCGDAWVDAGAGEQCEPPNTPTCDSTCRARCDLTGTWGVKLSATISWTASPGIVAGSGALTSWAKVTRTLSGTSASDVAVPCGLVMPDFNSIVVAGISELYGLTYPSVIFDNGTLAPFTSTGTFSGLTPGATFSSSDSASLLGLTLSNALTSAWPTNSTVQQVDHDGDGKPAITALVKTGGNYRMIPVEATLATRADAFRMAFRYVTALNGTLDSCTQLSGAANLIRLERLIVGCRLTTGVDCTTAQRDFLVANSFPYVAPIAATYRMVKLSSSATCSDVRSTLP